VLLANEPLGGLCAFHSCSEETNYPSGAVTLKGNQSEQTLAGRTRAKGEICTRNPSQRPLSPDIELVIETPSFPEWLQRLDFVGTVLRPEIKANRICLNSI